MYIYVSVSVCVGVCVFTYVVRKEMREGEKTSVEGVLFIRGKKQVGGYECARAWGLGRPLLCIDHCHV